jgi:hypothetical protein
MFESLELTRERSAVALLILFHILVCCFSLVYVSQVYVPYHLIYDSARLLSASLVVAAIAPVSILFAFARFTFGYFVGFYFYTMTVGYLWINFFSDWNYDRWTAGLSAAASIVAFLFPALFVSSPIKQIGTVSVRTFNRLLTMLFLLCAATAAVGASYNFRFVRPSDASDLRLDSFPTILVYLIAITSSSLLPFLFACFVAQKNRWGAGAVLVLLLFYYPIAVSKTAFFAPVWLVFLVLYSRCFKSRIAVISSLLLPVLAGTILFFLFKNDLVPARVAEPFFLTVNFRMIAIPSIAMDVYNDFFSTHEHTYFCQIRMLKPFVSCPYQDQLGIMMLNEYPFGGNFNASLFATEGIASVGLLLAPASVFVGGLIVALGNRLSAGLPCSFVLVSGAILPMMLLNIPLLTVLLTHGAGFLFLLWYITPRSMFQRT